MVRWYIWDSGDRVRVWYVYCVHMTKPRVLVRDVSSFGCIPSSLWIPSVVCLPFCCLVKWRQRGAWGPLLDRFWRSFPTASYRQHSKDSNSNISIAADLFVGWAVLFYSLKWVLATVRERFYFILYSYFYFYILYLYSYFIFLFCILILYSYFYIFVVCSYISHTPTKTARRLVTPHGPALFPVSHKCSQPPRPCLTFIINISLCSRSYGHRV